MNWWLVVIHFLHSLQMALTASELIYLMMSALHPSASAALFNFAFLTDCLKPAEVKSTLDEESPRMLSMNQASLEGLLVDGVPVVSGCVPLHPRHPQR